MWIDDHFSTSINVTQIWLLVCILTRQGAPPRFSPAMQPRSGKRCSSLGRVWAVGAHLVLKSVMNDRKQRFQAVYSRSTRRPMEQLGYWEQNVRLTVLGTVVSKELSGALQRDFLIRYIRTCSALLTSSQQYSRMKALTSMDNIWLTVTILFGNIFITSAFWGNAIVSFCLSDAGIYMKVLPKVYRSWPSFRLVSCWRWSALTFTVI